MDIRMLFKMYKYVIKVEKMFFNIFEIVWLIFKSENIMRWLNGRLFCVCMLRKKLLF